MGDMTDAELDEIEQFLDGQREKNGMLTGHEPTLWHLVAAVRQARARQQDAEQRTEMAEHAQADCHEAEIALYARLDEAEARNRQSFCVWCGTTFEHQTLAARPVEIVAHQTECPERPEPRLLDALSAAERRIAALTTRLREYMIGNHEAGWGAHIGHRFEDCPAALCVSGRALLEEETR